jgi:O-Antigen ligase
MLVFALGVLFCTLILLASLFFGVRDTVIGALIFALCVVPVTLYRGDQLRHSGVAGATVSISTYTVLIASAVVVGLFIAKRSASIAASILPLTLYLGFGMLFIWDSTSENWAGFVQYLLAPVAFFSGRALFNGPIDKAAQKRLVLVLAGVIGLQLMVGGLQFAGLEINSVSRQSLAFVAGRVNGSLDHPNTLGKVLVLLCVLLLPLSRMGTRFVSRLATLTLASAIVLIALTGGRANFIGVVIMLLVWSMLLPRSGRFQRLLIPGIVLSVGLAFLGYFLERFQEDPTGGSRDRLLSVAEIVVAMNPWLGVGPNSYVTAAASVDSYTAITGLPVHNTFLLVIGELGIIGLAALLLPVAIATIRSAKFVRVEGIRGDFARALVASSPAVFLIGMTGFGMVAGAILPLWYFIVGICAGQAVSFGARAVSPASSTAAFGRGGRA